MRRLIWILLLGLVAAGFAWAFRPRPVPVELAAVARRTIEATVEEEGRTRIREVFTVSAPTAGRIARLGLHAGDPVVAGETVVASISPAAPALLDARSRRVAEAAREAAVAALGLAEAELGRAEAQATFAEAELERAGRLFARGTVPERMLEAARLEAAAAQAAVASAQAALGVRRQELASAEAALTEDGSADAGACCVAVAAPASGVILRVLAGSETVVAPGTPLLEIGDPADLEVVVDLLSADAVRVAAGAEAAVTDWGGPDLPARLRRVDPSAFTRVSALGIEEQRVTAVLDLGGEPAARAGLGDGYRVTVRILVRRGEDLPAVPVGALFRSGASWAVWRVEDGRAALTPVGIGLRDDDWAEVTEGLAEGAAVVLHPSDRVAEGVRVAAQGG